MGKRFVTIFKGLSNTILTKPLGMIPYILYKHYGYDSAIVAPNIKTLNILKNELKGLKLVSLDTKNDPIDECKKYIINNANNIDILNVYHYRNYTIDWINTYKEVNPQGKVFLKLDAGLSLLNKNSLYDNEYINTLKKCDIISVETKELYNALNNILPVKATYLPCGFYAKDYLNYEKIEYTNKENIICTAGKLGNPIKSTDILLEAFALASKKIPNWKLKLFGRINPEFEGYIEQFFLRNSELKDRVEFCGFVSDKELLYEEYKKAKIFCFPSKVESFGIALIEALSNGCYPIGTKIPSIIEMTNNGKYGTLFDVDNVEQFCNCLISVCNNEELIKKMSPKIQRYVYENYNWVKICGEINELLNK